MRVLAFWPPKQKAATEEQPCDPSAKLEFGCRRMCAAPRPRPPRPRPRPEAARVAIQTTHLVGCHPLEPIRRGAVRAA